MTVEMSTMERGFLAKLRSDGAEVNVFLMTGVKLVGVITSFDEAGLLLSGRGCTQLVYRHSIATVVPS